MDYKALCRELLENLCTHPMGWRAGGPIDEVVRGEKFMLHFLARRGGFVLPGELSHEMGVSSARVAAALNRLEKKGLVTRQMDPADRRKILVALTPEGETEYRLHHEEMLDKGAALLEQLGEPDAREYVRILCRIAEIASAELGANA